MAVGEPLTGEPGADPCGVGVGDDVHQYQAGDAAGDVGVGEGGERGEPAQGGADHDDRSVFAAHQRAHVGGDRAQGCRAAGALAVAAQVDGDRAQPRSGECGGDRGPDRSVLAAGVQQQHGRSRAGDRRPQDDLAEVDGVLAHRGSPPPRTGAGTGDGRCSVGTAAPGRRPAWERRFRCLTGARSTPVRLRHPREGSGAWTGLPPRPVPHDRRRPVGGSMRGWSRGRVVVPGNRLVTTRPGARGTRWPGGHTRRASGSNRPHPSEEPR